jgi:hypothetical protein
VIDIKFELEPGPARSAVINAAASLNLKVTRVNPTEFIVSLADADEAYALGHMSGVNYERLARLVRA